MGERIGIEKISFLRVIFKKQDYVYISGFLQKFGVNHFFKQNLKHARKLAKHLIMKRETSLS